MASRTKLTISIQFICSFLTILSSMTCTVSCFTPISYFSSAKYKKTTLCLPKKTSYEGIPHATSNFDIPCKQPKKNNLDQTFLAIHQHHHPHKKLISLQSLPTSFSPLEEGDSVEDFGEDEPWGGWVAFGLSCIYLSHFSSLYTQLPGLYGPTGLQPISSRLLEVIDRCWVLQHIPTATPEFGLELFTVMGIIISSSQIIFGPKLRNGLLGILTYTIQWVLWHDLVSAGGRFTSYQMDSLLIDAGPIAILAASYMSPRATTFAYRWLLTRLYLGAGAVKILSCDASWRDLSAVHWHFQSQPLPNIFGNIAYNSLPNHPFGEIVTLGILIIEMAAPFLFLSPSSTVRRVAFVMNNILMAGIMLFGNFGPLQVLLMVIGIALLDEDVHLPPAPGSIKKKKIIDENTSTPSQVDPTDSNLDWATAAVTAASLALACGATIWTIHDVFSSCSQTWSVSPLVYDSIILALASFLLYCIVDQQKNTNLLIDLPVGLALILGSSVPLTREFGLPAFLPFISPLLLKLNPGASSYGLFAIITGADGTRPTLSIMASYDSIKGPWEYVPLLYQVNDPNSNLPLCFPHFPRLDWSLWFVPLGEMGSWINRFMYGILMGDDAVLHLIDVSKFQHAFPNGPPEFVKLDVSGYEIVDMMNGGGGGGGHDVWLAGQPPVDGSRVARAAEMINGIYTKDDFFSLSYRTILSEKTGATTLSWPSIPVVRSLADWGRPEWFIWSCFLFSGIAQIAVSNIQSNEEDVGVTVDVDNREVE